MYRLDIVGYKQALAEGIPQLKDCQVEFLAEGGNSVACLVDQQWVFLFPKTAHYEQKLLRQLKLLPRLASGLPLPIPDFKYISYKPTSVFPFAFAGYKMIQGTQVVDCAEEVWEAEWLLKPFGQFVTALHQFPLNEAVELGILPFDMVQWRGFYHDWWQSRVRPEVYPILSDSESFTIEQYFKTYLNNPHHFEFEPVLLHADLHLAHILLDLANQRINGVIDFGDCKIGDPALDIRNAWEPFYAGKRDATWHERRIFYYKTVPLFEITIGIENGNATEINQGIAAFRHKWQVL